LPLDIVHNAFNDGFGIAALHLIAKYVEFGVIQGPVQDRWIKAGTRSKVLGAFDIAINSRWGGLGPVGIMTKSQEGSGPSNTIQSKGKGTAVKFEQERWLPYVNIDRTRLQATMRHLQHALVHYITIDTLMGLIDLFGEGTIANPHYTPNSIPTFINTHTFTLLPHFYPLTPPTWVIWSVVELSVAAGVWQGISWGYHFFGFLGVGSGLYEVEAWEIDHFDAPWKADSLLDMWGKRWHQMFRVSPPSCTMLIVASFLITRYLRTEFIRFTTKSSINPTSYFLLFRCSTRIRSINNVTCSTYRSTHRILFLFRCRSSIRRCI